MFYVYRLIDPRTLKPFYIGKGTGDRILAHEKEAARGKQSRKCEMIREIRASGLEIVREKIKEFEDEKEAYAYEKLTIEQIGIKNLTNIMHGGVRDFGSNIVNAVCRSLIPQKYNNTQKRNTLEKLERYLYRIDGWLERGCRVYFPIPNGEETAKSFYNMLKSSVNRLRAELGITAVITLPLGDHQ